MSFFGYLATLKEGDPERKRIERVLEEYDSSMKEIEIKEARRSEEVESGHPITDLLGVITTIIVVIWLFCAK